jgi:hypothetical protein
MNKDASDFMMQEYDQIASAYFGLHDEVNEWFKAYLALVGLPLTVLAAVLKVSDSQTTVSIANLPDVVSGLLIAVALLGFFVAMTIITMRTEMILYARTINVVRRYFAELDRQAQHTASMGPLSAYLVLPTSDAKPPFFESWRAMFWQIVLVGALDGLILTVAAQSLFKIGWLWSVAAGAAYCSLHLIMYWWLAQWRQGEWHTRFPESLRPDQD